VVTRTANNDARAKLQSVYEVAGLAVVGVCGLRALHIFSPGLLACHPGHPLAIHQLLGLEIRLMLW